MYASYLIYYKKYTVYTDEVLNGLQVFFSEIAVFRRERFNGTYRIGWYYFTKMLAEFPIYIINPAVYMTIGYWMVGLNSKPDRFFIAIGMSTLLANIGASIGETFALLSIRSLF